MSTTETAGVFDSMTISLLRPDESRIVDLATVDNTAEAHVWQEMVFDLSPYAGQTVVLYVAALSDAACHTYATGDMHSARDAHTRSLMRDRSPACAVQRLRRGAAQHEYRYNAAIGRIF